MKKLAIIGAGSSGLITLQTALEHLPDWEITCYEKSSSIQGCWGNPYPGFISTSTKYTTQFSCFQQYDDSIDASREKNEFFKDGEYGQYLESFAERFRLHEHIRLETPVLSIEPDSKLWRVTTQDGSQEYNHIIICTGLAEQPKKITSTIPFIQSMHEIEDVKGKQVVIMGGGESAADLANRLAQPERENTVYLSLKGGIRVSPRYHPIRGVPSDFLRNRLLLSISQGLRNRIGQRFVEARIRYQVWFERLFPNKGKSTKKDTITERRKSWDYRLTKASKDNLFNMFHNKSDGFLEAIGEGRINIIGAPVDESHYYEFENSEVRELSPDLLIPMIGFESNLEKLFRAPIQVKDFYLGCSHVTHSNLHLVGFARPIIGNIPSISEQQALYIIQSILGAVSRPIDIKTLHLQDRTRLQSQFPKLNLDALYPVEMFPYCDQLARSMGTYPERRKLGWRRWFRCQLSPASTLHYSNYAPIKTQIYTPPILNLLLILIKLLDRK